MLPAAMLLACSTSAPNKSSEPSENASSVGSSAEALRKLGQLDANDVQQCRDVADACSDGADSGSNAVCDQISAHCDALEAQLAADRADLEQCLQEAADCEQTATDPAQCADQRAACEPKDGNFRTRRGQTMQCAGRAEQCIAPGRGFFGRGFGRRGFEADAGDAGAVVCDDSAVDFVGCCQGKHHDGDAGVGVNGIFGGPRGPGRPGQVPGAGPQQHDNDNDNDDDRADAGAPRRGPPAPPFGFGRAP